MKKNDAVDDLTRPIPSCGAERHVVHLQLRQHLAVRKVKVLDDEIVLLLVGPVRLRRSGRKAQCESKSEQDAELHESSPAAGLIGVVAMYMIAAVNRHGGSS